MMNSGMLFFCPPDINAAQRDRERQVGQQCTERLYQVVGYHRQHLMLDVSRIIGVYIAQTYAVYRREQQRRYQRKCVFTPRRRAAARLILRLVIRRHRASAVYLTGRRGAPRAYPSWLCGNSAVRHARRSCVLLRGGCVFYYYRYSNIFLPNSFLLQL